LDDFVASIFFMTAEKRVLFFRGKLFYAYTPIRNIDPLTMLIPFIFAASLKIFLRS